MVDELELSQNTEALVDAMVFNDGDDGSSDEGDMSYTMGESSDDDDEVGVDDSCFVKEVREIDECQKVTSVVTDYEVDDATFSEADVEEWRKRRKICYENTKMGIVVVRLNKMKRIKKYCVDTHHTLPVKPSNSFTTLGIRSETRQ